MIEVNWQCRLNGLHKFVMGGQVVVLTILGAMWLDKQNNLPNWLRPLLIVGGVIVVVLNIVGLWFLFSGWLEFILGRKFLEVRNEFEAMRGASKVLLGFKVLG